VKKLIALLLMCGMVTFTLTAVTGCGKDTKPGTGSPASKSSESKPESKPDSKADGK
jgi:hypothetical protein